MHLCIGTVLTVLTLAKHEKCLERDIADTLFDEAYAYGETHYDPSTVTYLKKCSRDISTPSKMEIMNGKKGPLDYFSGLEQAEWFRIATDVADYLDLDKMDEAALALQSLVVKDTTIHTGKVIGFDQKYKKETIENTVFEGIEECDFIEFLANILQYTILSGHNKMPEGEYKQIVEDLSEIFPGTQNGKKISGERKKESTMYEDLKGVLKNKQWKYGESKLYGYPGFGLKFTVGKRTVTVSVTAEEDMNCIRFEIVLPFTCAEANPVVLSSRLNKINTTLRFGAFQLSAKGKIYIRYMMAYTPDYFDGSTIERVIISLTSAVDRSYEEIENYATGKVAPPITENPAEKEAIANESQLYESIQDNTLDIYQIKELCKLVDRDNLSNDFLTRIEKEFIAGVNAERLKYNLAYATIVAEMCAKEDVDPLGYAKNLIVNGKNRSEAILGTNIAAMTAWCHYNHVNAKFAQYDCGDVSELMYALLVALDSSYSIRFRTACEALRALIIADYPYDKDYFLNTLIRKSLFILKDSQKKDYFRGVISVIPITYTSIQGMKDLLRSTMGKEIEEDFDLDYKDNNLEGCVAGFVECALMLRWSVRDGSLMEWFKKVQMKMMTNKNPNKEIRIRMLQIYDQVTALTESMKDM
jgi:hypothetical protein